ncbi:MAG: HNH endonuclease [Flavobacteriaceae bacterium]|nr:HNH endonuclease [Flavobacteriaceae bacterium]
MNTLEISQVWAKAKHVGEKNELNGFRKDKCGAWIKLSAYGDRDNKFGWEVDHITPVAKGGSDVLNNLSPLHWKNNAAKSDGPLVCAIVSHGDTNIAV